MNVQPHPSYDRFMQLCDRLQDALIYDLTVQGATVVWEPEPRILRQTPRPRRGNGPSREARRHALNRLARACRQMGDGTFALVRVEKGVPTAFYRQVQEGEL